MTDRSTPSDCPGCPEALHEEWITEKYRDTRLPCAECGQVWDFAPRPILRPTPRAEQPQLPVAIQSFVKGLDLPTVLTKAQAAIDQYQRIYN